MNTTDIERTDTPHPTPEIQADAGENARDGATPSPNKKPDDRFDIFVAKVRDRSPAAVINNASRINLGLRAVADGLSVASAVRKGSASKWRFRASIITLVSEGLGVFFSEKKVSEEQQQKYAEMSKPRYFFTKTLQAFNPKDHIFESVGLVTVLNGVLTAMSGYSQSVRNRVSWEIAQGVLTSIAGLFLTYTPDRERAQQIAHGLFFVRAPAAAIQAKNAYFVGVPEKNIAKGDWQQGAKWVFNQLANTVGVLYGGIKKMPDGSIIHIGKKGEEVTAPRQSRRQLASANMVAQASEASAQPNTRVEMIERQDVLNQQKEALVEVA